jgi:glycosyltransferase involved in cell wall biosynthesis
MTAGAYVAWIALADCDVMFGANFFLPRLHAAVAKRRVITIHDLTYKRYPELVQKETLENLERQMMREVALADAIVCVSESTRRELLRFYDVDPARAVAIHSGLGKPAVSEPMEGLPRRYLLFVSTIEPRKDLGTLLDAYERLRDSGAYDGSLVVVGKVGWKAKELVPRPRGRGRAPRLRALRSRRSTSARRRSSSRRSTKASASASRRWPAACRRSPQLVSPRDRRRRRAYFEPRDVDGLRDS